MKKAICTVIGVLAIFPLSARNAGIVTDIDGNRYPTVIIGEQEWMAENLRTTKFNDGTPIPMMNDYRQWGNTFSPAYGWYNNNETYKNTYGALYNWYAVNTGKLCPTGWHVPTKADWSKLIEYLGGKTIAGGKLKSTDSEFVQEEFSEKEIEQDQPGFVEADGVEAEPAAVDRQINATWNSPNTGATNETGFSALPGGRWSGHRPPGSYEHMGNYSYFWTADEGSPAIAWHKLLYHDNSHISLMTIIKTDAQSVRCVRN